MAIELLPRDKAATARGTLWVRMPQWASAAKVVASSGDAVSAPAEGGYLRIDRDFKAGDKLTVNFQNTLVLEGRRFLKVQVARGQVARVKDVAVLAGPDFLFATPVETAGRPALLATRDSAGRLSFPLSSGGQLVTVALPGIDAPDEQIAQAMQSARPVFLQTWPGIVASRRRAPAFISAVSMGDLGKSRSMKARRLPFMFDLVVVPAISLGANLARLAVRAKATENEQESPIFGENLERRPEIWPRKAGWKFTPKGLLVSAGDTGLIDGAGYGDYRFEFELIVPKEGQGITGWVVRATDEGNCLMFQLQTADSTFNAPQFKTRPNTLRPHRCIGGQWQIAEPVALPNEIHKGEPHRIAVECRKGKVNVFLDGQRIYSQADVDPRGGTVGFRASGPNEQGLFRN